MTIENLPGMPVTSGDVGMFGFSCVGATQLLAAVARPPSLRSIAPGFTASQYYDGWTYNGGALAAAFVCYWANLLALGSAVRAEDRAAVDALSASLGAAEGWFWWLPMSEFPPLHGGHAPYFYDWVEHCTYDDYWKRWSIDADYSRIEGPGPALRGLVGRVPQRNGEELHRAARRRRNGRGPQRPEAAGGPVDAHAVDAGEPLRP